MHPMWPNKVDKSMWSNAAALWTGIREGCRCEVSEVQRGLLAGTGYEPRESCKRWGERVRVVVALVSAW